MSVRMYKTPLETEQDHAGSYHLFHRLLTEQTECSNTFHLPEIY